MEAASADATSLWWVRSRPCASLPPSSERCGAFFLFAVLWEAARRPTGADPFTAAAGARRAAIDGFSGIHGSARSESAMPSQSALLAPPGLGKVGMARAAAGFDLRGHSRVCSALQRSGESSLAPCKAVPGRPEHARPGDLIVERPGRRLRRATVRTLGLLS